MALPAQPGALRPTPTQRLVSPGYVSAADYLAGEVGRLQAMNQNQNVKLEDITQYLSDIYAVLKAAETV